MFFWIIAFCVLASFSFAFVSDTDVVSVFAQNNSGFDSVDSNGLSDTSMSYLSGVSCVHESCADYDGGSTTYKMLIKTKTDAIPESRQIMWVSEKLSVIPSS